MRFTVPEIYTDDYPKPMRKAFAAFQQGILQAWRDYNDALRPLLPPPLDRVLDFNFQDSPLCAVQWDEAARTLTLLLWEGPRLANEYIPWYLTYRDVEMTDRSRRLLAHLATDEGADVADHELDIVSIRETPLYAHRILWHVDFAETRELEIHFRGFEWRMGDQPMTEMYKLRPEENVGVEELMMNREEASLNGPVVEE